MEKTIGYWTDAVYGEIPIVKKDDGNYYRRYSDEDELFPREMYQYSMTNPWEHMHFNFEKKDGQYVAKYISPIYDTFDCNICGFGNDLDYAMLDLIKNIFDIMNDYNEEKVEEFMDNYDDH